MPVDTDHSPFDQGTNASSAISVMGQAVDRAALAARRQILDFAAGMLDCPAEELDLVDWEIRRGNEAHPLAPMVMGHFGGTGWEFVGEGFHKARISATPHRLRRPACSGRSAGAAPRSRSIPKPARSRSKSCSSPATPAGQSIRSPCRGQDEGAAVMGLSQALFERMIYDGARLVNGDALMYRVPLADDLPADFRSVTQETGPRPRPVRRQGHGRRRHAAGRQRHRQRHPRRRRHPPHRIAVNAGAGCSPRWRRRTAGKPILTLIPDQRRTNVRLKGLLVDWNNARYSTVARILVSWSKQNR